MIRFEGTMTGNYYNVVLPSWNPHEVVKLHKYKIPVFILRLLNDEVFRCYAFTDMSVETSNKLEFTDWGCFDEEERKALL